MAVISSTSREGWSISFSTRLASRWSAVKRRGSSPGEGLGQFRRSPRCSVHMPGRWRKRRPPQWDPPSLDPEFGRSWSKHPLDWKGNGVVRNMQKLNSMAFLVSIHLLNKSAHLQCNFFKLQYCCYILQWAVPHTQPGPLVLPHLRLADVTRHSPEYTFPLVEMAETDMAVMVVITTDMRMMTHVRTEEIQNTRMNEWMNPSINQMINRY